MSQEQQIQHEFNMPLSSTQQEVIGCQRKDESTGNRNKQVGNEDERSPVSSRRMMDEDGRNQMGMIVEINKSFDFRKTNKVPVDFENQRETFEASDEDTPGQKTKSIKGFVLKFGRRSAKMLKLSETLKRPEESVPPEQNRKAAGEKVRFLLSSRRSARKFENLDSNQQKKE